MKKQKPISISAIGLPHKKTVEDMKAVEAFLELQQDLAFQEFADDPRNWVIEGKSCFCNTVKKFERAEVKKSEN